MYCEHHKALYDLMIYTQPWRSHLSDHITLHSPLHHCARFDLWNGAKHAL